MKLYNSLSRQKEEFKPINPGKVGMYACGPTVYDYAHIGNLKTFIFEDILRRYLEYSGYETRYIMNITDVGHLTADNVNQADSGEDKMLKAALREKKTPEEIANFYTENFFEDIQKLNFVKANFYPCASAHIPQMIKLIEELLKKGYAYEVNGNVFYDIEKFEGYGKLSGKKLEDLKNGARLEEHPDKKHPYDFALWLKAPEAHILKWKSPWSLGYPGWHIECSAMSMEYLGETFDIHTGGEDHFFPHHENEIAQSEGATGKKFANYWLHSRFLLIDGQKMSKSKGGFSTLKDIEEKGYSPMELRLFALSGHYRSNQNFTWKAMDQAQINFQRISDFVNNLKTIFSKAKLSENQSSALNLKKYQEKFEKAMDDDLNTPLALSVLYELITETNKLNPENKKEILSLWEKMNKVFGLIIATEKNTEIDGETQKLIDEREEARKIKDFQKSDELRRLIEEKGYLLEDLKEGYKIKKK
ncbi:MAG: cysteine--tRNA ligase [bacterium]|nr:cysteine--tRNA ligase [bacterium]